MPFIMFELFNEITVEIDVSDIKDVKQLKINQQEKHFSLDIS
jgi:hypothetical protein